jgi:protein PsiE
MLKQRPLQSSLLILSWIEYFILIIVTLATLTAVTHEVINLVQEAQVHVSDLLLLFIYLEVISMVAVYLESGQVPVRMPLYIAMVALARYLILDMKNLDAWTMVAIAGAILLIALAVLVVRYGHVKYRYESSSGHGDKHE